MERATLREFVSDTLPVTAEGQNTSRSHTILKRLQKRQHMPHITGRVESGYY